MGRPRREGRRGPKTLFSSAEAQVLGLREVTVAELEIVIEDALKGTLPQGK